MGSIIAYPIKQNVFRVVSVAREMATRSETQSEVYLLSEIQREWDRLLNAGVEQVDAEKVVIEFAQAIRAQLWREVFSRPGGVS